MTSSAASSTNTNAQHDNRSTSDTPRGAGVNRGRDYRGVVVEALLRCADPGQVEAATSVLDHIARASSSNATATRRFAGSSAASS
jgi:hypothetical protein